MQDIFLYMEIGQFYAHPIFNLLKIAIFDSLTTRCRQTLLLSLSLSHLFQHMEDLTTYLSIGIPNGDLMGSDDGYLLEVDL